MMGRFLGALWVFTRRGAVDTAWLVGVLWRWHRRRQARRRQIELVQAVNYLLARDRQRWF